MGYPPPGSKLNNKPTEKAVLGTLFISCICLGLVILIGYMAG
jgi:hypothetical protein